MRVWSAYSSTCTALGCQRAKKTESSGREALSTAGKCRKDWEKPMRKGTQRKARPRRHGPQPPPRPELHEPPLGAPARTKPLTPPMPASRASSKLDWFLIHCYTQTRASGPCQREYKSEKALETEGEENQGQVPNPARACGLSWNSRLNEALMTVSEA